VNPSKITVKRVELRQVVKIAPELPLVFTTGISKISFNNVEVSADVAKEGSERVVERGICYSKVQLPSTTETCIPVETGLGSFSINLTQLSDATTYYVRAYATNNVGMAYEAQVSFTTLSYSARPIVVTKIPVSNITSNSVTATGNVTSQGQTTVILRGVCYSTSPNPTINNTCVQAGSGLGSFNANLIGLNEATTYYVRAYATNSEGTFYGDNVSFKTKSMSTFPLVTTSEVSNVTHATATVSGNVTIQDIDNMVTARGICYSTSPNPTVADSCVSTSPMGPFYFSVNMTKLNPSTTYYVRTYATNNTGTIYGNTVSFKTKNN